MKKKLLFCIHNYFFLQHYILDLKKLEKDFEITILTSNYLVTNSSDEYQKINQQTKIKNIFFIPFYKINLQRSIYSILSTHLFLLKLKQKINFKEFQICITDSKFFIWQRIVIDEFISKKCKKIGIVTGSIALDLSIFKKLLEGESINKFVNNLHKLRQYNLKKRVREKNIYIKYQNIKNRYLDIFFDRKFLSYLFHLKNFDYKKYDLNIMETDNFDYKIIFHYANYLFWREWYEKKENVILARHENNCICHNEKKNKILFISSLLWNEKKEEISNQVDNIVKFFKKKIEEIPNITELHIKHHPQENDQKIETVNNLFITKLDTVVNINFIDKQKSVNEIACDYLLAFGMMSTALNDVKKACNKIQVFCLKSINLKEFDDDYFLKLLNEGIIFYDDLNNQIDHNVNQYSKYINNFERVKFSNFIRNL